MIDSTYSIARSREHDIPTRHPLFVRALQIAATAVLAPHPAAQAPSSTPAAPPNLVPISERLVTSGSPSAARQGLAYVNIPIDFESPAERDYTLLAAVLRGLTDRKALVHCQITLRASSRVFLYRAIALREDPDLAYESVARVWKPEGAWHRFIEAQLQSGGLAFRPY